jgi:hypothetical protein
MDGSVTVHILPSFNKSANLCRVQSLLSSLPATFVHHKDQCLWKYQLPLSDDTRWWMYVYDSEWMDDDLIASLPVYFQQSHSDHDSYTLKKGTVYPGGTVRFFDTPRIFANYVTLRYGCLMPNLNQKLRPEFILDGMLWDALE